MNFYQSCKHFLPDRPCEFHKKTSDLVCSKCKFYEPKTSKYKKILIIKLSAIGDVLRTTSILKPLFRKYKGWNIYWLTYPESVPVLENNPYIKRVINFNNLWEIINERFDILINLDLEENALYLTKIFVTKKKVGFYLDEKNKIKCSNKFAETWFNLSHNDELKKKNKITYQEHILGILGFNNIDFSSYPIILNLSNEEKKFAEQFALSHSIRNEDIVIGINSGGGDKWPKKSLPEKNTIELVKLIVTNIKNSKVLIFGGEKETQRNKKIIARLKLKNLENIVDTGTKNSLREFFALINLCDILITTDTLALHAGLGLGKKIISLFGPTSAEEIELYGKGEKVVAPISCVCCYNRECEKDPYCMSLITPEMIYNKLLKLIK